MCVPLGLRKCRAQRVLRANLLVWLTRLFVAVAVVQVSWGLDRLGNWTQGAGQTDGGNEFVHARCRAGGTRQVLQRFGGRRVCGRMV